jgi:hypothetical protein
MAIIRRGLKCILMRWVSIVICKCANYAIPGTRPKVEIHRCTKIFPQVIKILMKYVWEQYCVNVIGELCVGGNKC